MPPFFERFRAEIRRYADGVHRLGDPAPASAVAGLPAELAGFLRSWDGAELFVDAWTIYPAARIARDGARVRFGETASGDALWVDGEGRVVRVEEDTGEELAEGTSFARWLEALVVAEGVIYDREGEYQEDLYDARAGELLPRVAEKRERKLLKLDPGAPAPTWRLARALERQGKARAARDLLVDVVARAPRFAWAWFDLGRLEREAGDLAAAETAFARAAESDPAYEHAGYFAAHAARAAAARSDEPARARHAARARDLDGDLCAAQKEAARRLLAEGGDRAAAREAAEIACALAPTDLDALDLARRLRG